MCGNVKKVKYWMMYFVNLFKRGNFKMLDIGWENEKEFLSKKVLK